MDIIYSEHAVLRMKQRGITKLAVEHVINYPSYVKKIHLDRYEILGEYNQKMIKIIFVKMENYIRVVTVI